jgi:antitoxin PrlF
MMDKSRPGTKVAEELFTAPEGATMDDIIRATGGPQYNVLANLEGRGFGVRKVKEGRRTRYFVTPPATQSFEATVTSQGQITIPKEVRDRLGVRPGGRLRFTLGPDGRIEVAPADLSVRRLFGILGKPPRSATLEEMDHGIRKAVVEKYLRAVGGKRR